MKKLLYVCLSLAGMPLSSFAMDYWFRGSSGNKNLNPVTTAALKTGDKTSSPVPKSPEPVHVARDLQNEMSSPPPAAAATSSSNVQKKLTPLAAACKQQLKQKKVIVETGITHDPNALTCWWKSFAVSYTQSVIQKLENCGSAIDDEMRLAHDFDWAIKREIGPVLAANINELTTVELLLNAIRDRKDAVNKLKTLVTLAVRAKSEAKFEVNQSALQLAQKLLHNQEVLEFTLSSKLQKESQKRLYECKTARKNIHALSRTPSELGYLSDDDYSEDKTFYKAVAPYLVEEVVAQEEIAKQAKEAEKL